jgi:diguanylate cyclase (GGDEF)-like protein
MNRRPPSRLSTIIFGAAPRQRRLLQRTLLASSVCIGALILDIFAVRAGFMDGRQLGILAIYSVAGIVAFYLVIRSGVNTRFGRMSSLTYPQQVFALTVMVWTFALAGPIRGAVISLLVLILMFGMFVFRPRATVNMAALALFMLAAAMFVLYKVDPAHYPFNVSAFQLGYAALAILPVSIVSAQIQRLQSALRARSQALEQAVEQIRRLAENDDLTDLLNRRAMIRAIEREMTPRQPVPGAICLALIDIDLFKSINDRFGHQAGDEVLRRFAKATKSTLRVGDMFARWGGEEFLLMLPDTSVERGLECLNRIREVLAATSFEAIAPGLKVTISAGVTDLHPADTLDMAVERADQAMYRAKQLGRDRVILGDVHAAASGMTTTGLPLAPE